MSDAWWLTAAISDDKVVADLLLRLKDSATSSPQQPPPQSCFLMTPLPPSWGLRHPRSKPSTSSLSLPPEKTANTRRSPTTPLSWNGSDGGCEASSSLNLHQPPSDRIRSKISAASDTPTTSTKRPRKKKTFSELKEEESSLLNERSQLKRELEKLHMTLKEQRSINQNLKRIKLDLQVESGIKLESNSGLELRIPSFLGTCEASSSTLSRQVKTEDPSSHLCLSQKGATSQEPIFVLPDLNMAPDECEVVGMS